MPAAQGVVNWPGTGRSASVLADPTMMPLPDAAVDRAILIHAVEGVESPAELMQEVWRVLTPGGRLIVAVPTAAACGRASTPRRSVTASPTAARSSAA